MTIISRILCLPLALVVAWPLVAGQSSPVDRLLDQIVQRERSLVMYLASRSPLVETYIQETPDGMQDDSWPNRDHYFLGRLHLAGGLDYTPLIERTERHKQKMWMLFKRSFVLQPVGFAQMIFPDAAGFTPENYGFEYVRREFLGSVRCLVFDVAPFDKRTSGRFSGRIWVEDRDYNIVRFNGTYTNSKPSCTYFHFDSWRVNVAPQRWVPAFVYVEESDPKSGKVKIPLFKAQTRLWGYDPADSNRLDELTTILIEAESLVRDSDGATDISPLSSQRLWEQQAEKNVIDRLEKSSLLAPAGEVDKVLNTVVNNLVVTNELAVAPRCRVLLTTPLESFSVGDTIVISRGLIDVLPDEASLAVVLASELAHIALGHRTNTQFAFNDQTMLNDVELLRRLQFTRTQEEIDSAGRKAAEILGNSPYREKLNAAGLFLKALTQCAPHFPNLIRANLGNPLASGGSLVRMRELAASAPDLERDKLNQIAALPLGSRVKLAPWRNEISLMKTAPVSLRSARDKRPFEITPLLIYLTRLGTMPSSDEVLTASTSE